MYLESLDILMGNMLFHCSQVELQFFKVDKHSLFAVAWASGGIFRTFTDININIYILK